MANFWPSILSAILAFGISVSELLTGTYARTYFLVLRSTWLYVYAVIYGLLGFFGMFLLDFLTASKLVTLQGVGLSSAWVQALIVGISIKAFLHIRLFNVNTGTSNVPIGVETVVQIFEPWLLRQIQLDHFNALRALIGPRAAKYTDLHSVKTTILANVPSEFSAIERAALKSDVDNAADVTQAMQALLYYLGKRTFERVFPP